MCYKWVVVFGCLVSGAMLRTIYYERMYSTFSAHFLFSFVHLLVPSGNVCVRVFFRSRTSRSVAILVDDNAAVGSCSETTICVSFSRYLFAASGGVAATPTTKVLSECVTDGNCECQQQQKQQQPLCQFGCKVCV